MAVAQDDRPVEKRRGRPRKKPEERMVRRTILLDPRDLESLRELYGAKTDAEAVRSAIYVVLTLAAAREIQEYNVKHGGPDDVYHRTTGQPKLPVYLKPGDVPEEELLWLDDDNAPLP